MAAEENQVGSITNTCTLDFGNDVVLHPATDGFCLLSVDGRLTEVNQTLCDMLGYTRAELTARTLADIEAVESSKEIAQHIAKIMQTGRERFKTRHRRKDGRIIDVEVSVQFCDFGNDKFLFAFWRYAGEYRRACEARVRKQREAGAIIESTDNCIHVWDRKHRYLYANEAAVKHAGTTREKVIGRDIKSGLGHVPEFMNLWKSRIDAVFKTGRSIEAEEKVPLGDRTVRLQSVVSPITDKSGQIFAVSAVYQDTTEKGN